MVVRVLLQQLGSQDLKVRSKAAENLGDYSYDEVIRALLTEVRSFLKDTEYTNPAYSWVFSACIESLIKLVTTDYSSEVQSLNADFAAAISASSGGGLTGIFGSGSSSEIRHKGISSKSAEKWGPRMQVLMSTVQTRTGTVARLPAAAQNTVDPKGLLINRLGSALTPDQAKLLEELLTEKDPNGELLDYFNKAILGSLDENHFNKGSKSIKDGKSRNFYGREHELELVAQALLRIDKGHVLLTGKAGVGKTTILKMLTDGWLKGTLPFPGSKPPVLLELSILDITNPTDPSAIRSRVAVAEQLAQTLGRHVVLMVDEAHVATSMTRNALKSFLTREMRTDSNVHFIWLTTSSESREFLDDTAFSRRWVSIDVREFTNAESIELIKKSYLPLWRERHVSDLAAIGDISDEAYQLAARFAKMENAHSGNPTGIKEILEGAIISRLRKVEVAIEAKGTKVSSPQKFTLEPADIRTYLKEHKGQDLIPGDAAFDETFEKKWKDLESEYVGNKGLMYLEKKDLKSHFTSVGSRRQVSARIYMGPPGAGKSFLPEMIAKYFFKTKALSINGAKYSEGGLGLNTLIGSPTGTVGSEQQRSVLTKYLKDNPQGGVIVFEEADLAHQDVFSFLVDAITSKEFEDGLGYRWNLENYLIILTTNVGQELMVATEAAQKKLNWDDLEMRRRALMETVYLDGEMVDMPKAEILTKLFEQFMAKVSKHSNPQTDSAVARTQNEKLERRFTPRYVMLPTRQELIEAAYSAVDRFVDQQKRENNVTFDISREDVEKVLDVDRFRIKEGFAYVGGQLEKRLFSYLSAYQNEKGKTIKIKVGEEEVKLGSKTLKGLRLEVNEGATVKTYSYGIPAPASENPWFNSPTMRERLTTFEEEMSKRVMNQDRQIKALSRMLKQKAMSWATRVVFTQLGTSGNGKTEFGYALAEVLYGDRNAAYKISGINTWGDLQNYFRSPTGFVGNNEETEFERWFMARKSMGGGVIILDELLSFYGLNQNEAAEKIKAINKLYDMLDEGVIRFGNRVEDASGFSIEITGNALQEFFAGIDDDPGSEKQVQLRLKSITENDIFKYFAKIGIDAAKMARFGEIFVNGPLPKEQSLKVGNKDLGKLVNEATADVGQLYDFEVKVDPAVVAEVIKRVSTINLGMRKVKFAIQKLVTQPLGEIFFNHMGVELIEVKLEDGKIVWYLDGKKSEQAWPQLESIEKVEKIKVDPAQLDFIGRHEFHGHWMVDYLLKRKNSTMSISLIPNEDSLGRVRFKPDAENYELDTLSSILGEIVSLEAGHRAVFISGLYATGGGSSGQRKKDETPSDDLGKVEQKIDQILSNNLLNAYREYGSAGNQKVFKAFMRDLAKTMADALIRYGTKTKVFDPLFDDLMRERYLGDDRIDSFVAGIQPGQLASAEKLMVWSLTVGLRKALRQTMARHSLKAADREDLMKLGRELLRKVTREAETMAKTKGVKVDSSLQDRRAKGLKSLEQISAGINKGKISCEAAID
jgi:ATP-dependent Clp protease ATP-binding subunit ClpA